MRAIIREVLNRDPRLDESWRDASEVYQEDFEYREDSSWPGAGTYRGIEAFRKVTSGYAEAFKEMDPEVERMFDAGNCVVAFIRLLGPWPRRRPKLRCTKRASSPCATGSWPVGRWSSTVIRPSKPPGCGSRRCREEYARPMARQEWRRTVIPG